jgi:hypothetical protein
MTMGTEQEDSYRLLMKGDGFRVGLTVGPGMDGPPSATVEFLFRLFRSGRRLHPQEMERATELVRRLTLMGYDVFFQEDGWISCEKPVDEAAADMVAQDLQDLMEMRPILFLPLE